MIRGSSSLALACKLWRSLCAELTTTWHLKGTSALEELWLGEGDLLLSSDKCLVPNTSFKSSGLMSVVATGDAGSRNTPILAGFASRFSGSSPRSAKSSSSVGSPPLFSSALNADSLSVKERELELPKDGCTDAG